MAVERIVVTSDEPYQITVTDQVGTVDAVTVMVPGAQGPQGEQGETGTAGQPVIGTAFIDGSEIDPVGVVQGVTGQVIAGSQIVVRCIEATDAEGVVYLKFGTVGENFQEFLYLARLELIATDRTWVFTPENALADGLSLFCVVDRALDAGAATFAVSVYGTQAANPEAPAEFLVTDMPGLDAWYLPTAGMYQDLAKTTPAGVGDPVYAWEDSLANYDDITSPASGNRPIRDVDGGVSGNGTDHRLRVQGLFQAGLPGALIFGISHVNAPDPWVGGVYLSWQGQPSTDDYRSLVNTGSGTQNGTRTGYAEMDGTSPQYPFSYFDSYNSDDPELPFLTFGGISWDGDGQVTIWRVDGTSHVRGTNGLADEDTYLNLLYDDYTTRPDEGSNVFAQSHLASDYKVMELLHLTEEITDWYWIKFCLAYKTLRGIDH